jgi:hypothetical protein
VTLYRAAQAAAATTIDAVFGEAFTLQPMKQTGGRWAADMDRAVVNLARAVLTEKSENLDMIGERNASGMSKGVASQLATAQATIDIEHGLVPYQVTKGDRLTRVETGDVYEVTAAPYSDLNRMVLRVVKLGRAA